MLARYVSRKYIFCKNVISKMPWRCYIWNELGNLPTLPSLFCFTPSFRCILTLFDAGNRSTPGQTTADGLGKSLEEHAIIETKRAGPTVVRICPEDNRESTGWIKIGLCSTIKLPLPETRGKQAPVLEKG